MPTDIVMPNNNEKEFVKVAERLGYKNLVFLYKKKQALPNLQTTLNIYTATVYPTQSKLTCYKADHKLRLTIEKYKPDLIFNQESLFSKDLMHQRSSGMDKPIANLLKKHNIILAFAIRQKKALGRMMQNIKLARKFKFPTAIITLAKEPLQMKSPHDLKALLIVLGMHPTEAKAAITFIPQKIKKKNYIKGIRILK